MGTSRLRKLLAVAPLAGLAIGPAACGESRGVGHDMSHKPSAGHTPAAPVRESPGATAARLVLLGRDGRVAFDAGRGVDTPWDLAEFEARLRSLPVVP